MRPTPTHRADGAACPAEAPETGTLPAAAKPTCSIKSPSDSLLVDERQPRGDAYRLERIDNGCVATIAIFYSAAEALTVLGCLDDG